MTYDCRSVRDNRKRVVGLSSACRVRQKSYRVNQLSVTGSSFQSSLKPQLPPQIVGDSKLHETPAHPMLINIVVPYASVDNPTFKIQINGAASGNQGYLPRAGDSF